MFVRGQSARLLLILAALYFYDALSICSDSFAQGNSAPPAGAEQARPEWRGFPVDAAELLKKLNKDIADTVEKLKQGRETTPEHSRTHVGKLIDSITDTATKFSKHGSLAVELELTIQSLQARKNGVAKDTNLNADTKKRYEAELEGQIATARKFVADLEGIYERFNRLVIGLQERSHELNYEHSLEVTRKALDAVRSVLDDATKWLDDAERRLRSVRPGT